MNILLACDTSFELDIDKLATLINSKTLRVKISTESKKIIIDQKLMSFPETHDRVFYKSLTESARKTDCIILSTNLPYEDNFFLHRNKNLNIVSFYGWKSLTTLSEENGLLYWITDRLLSFIIPTSENRHYKETGCLNDFLGYKSGIDVGMRKAYLCQECLEKINKKGLDTIKSEVLNDLILLLDMLSQKSRWNKSIFELLEVSQERKQINLISKRVPVKQNEINIIIASPSDTEREREIIINRLERHFRMLGFEASTEFRIIVHGWEDLASQSGYAQDVINNIILSRVDIVIGILKHKLGSPTFDSSGIQRAQSGTVEEIYYALEKNPDKVLSMVYFYSIAPQISLDDEKFENIRENWNKLQEFKKSIQNKVIYKPYSTAEDLLDLIAKDLMQNILNWFKK